MEDLYAALEVVKNVRDALVNTLRVRSAFWCPASHQQNIVGYPLKSQNNLCSEYEIYDFERFLIIATRLSKSFSFLTRFAGRTSLHRWMLERLA